MNFDDILQSWRSPLNRPPALQLENDKMKFIADLRGRRRGFLLFLVWVFAALALVTGRFFFHVLWPDPTMDRIEVTREWGTVVFLAAPWLAWILLVRQYRRHHVTQANYARSIADSVRAALDENRVSRTVYRTVALLHLAMLVILPVVVYQLRTAGKAGDEILVPALVVWPAIALSILGGMFYNYRRKLLPRKRELEALLAAYEV